LGGRITSITDWTGDASNTVRLRDMRRGLRRAVDRPPLQVLFGEGPAATGNAKKLTGQAADSTESFLIKMVVEVGFVGGIAVIAFLLVAGVLFARAARRASPDVRVQAAAAAGAGLSLDSVAYQTLEVQLIAATWWLLLLTVLKAARRAPAS
jgi:hypothetical protein